ncbi:MAG: hypothetical protein ACTSWX_00140 [Promethearchaeota archaeon]
MTEETKINNGIWGLISLILGVGGVFFSYLFIYLHLGNILSAETAAAQECSLTAPFFIPLFAVIGILGGILWLVASVGFFQKKEWAYSVSVIAVVIALFASFWPNIPAMESKAAIPGPWFLIFLPNLLIYFYLLRSIGKESRRKVWFGLGVGMAYILEFINGIAATTRMVNRLPDYSSASTYMLTFLPNMFASILFGFTVVGLFLGKKKDLVRIIGLCAVFLAIFAGFPLAFYSMFFADTNANFSMFIMGPFVSLLIGFVFMSSKLWDKTVGNTE